MESKTAGPLSKLCGRTLVLALFLALVPALRPASAANPCAAYPHVCRYTWDPVSRCCVADPRFDCFDVCFASAVAPSASWPAMSPSATPAATPVGGLPGTPAPSPPALAGLSR
jgi:hypothetical protein